MSRVLIKSGEVFVSHEGAPPAKRKHNIISDLLQQELTLESTTFGQFFELLSPEPEFFQKVFASHMAGVELQPFLDELRKPAETLLRGVDHLEIYWAGMVDEHGEIGIDGCFHGVGEDETSYALELTPLNELRDIELKLNTTLRIDMERIHMMNIPLLQAERKFTIYDALNAILYEITWNGSIEDRMRQIEELQRRMDEDER